MGAALTFMAGGKDKAFAAAKPVLGAGKDGQEDRALRRRWSKPSGQDRNNMILGISMIAVSEAFLLAEKLGLSHQVCSMWPRPPRDNAGR
jgi:3-hydroxyisobutyrate dehydrogenase